MAKYVDLEVIHDAKITKIEQTTVKVGVNNGVVVVPVTSDNTTTPSASQKRLLFQSSDNTWRYNNGAGDIVVGSVPATAGITFTASNLTNGILTITHNTGHRYPLDLRYTVAPRGVTFTDTTIQLDYSDQPSTFTGGTIYFVGALQSMLTS